MPTYADIDARVLNKLGNNSVFWASTERTAAFNEALGVWQSMVGEWTSTANLTPDGSVFLDVPRQIITPQRVSYNGTPLDLTSLEELDLGTPGWQTRSNLLSGGGFESWPASLPAGWTTFGTSVTQNEVRTSGALGAKLVKEGVANPISGVTQTVTVTPSTPTVLQVWALVNTLFPGRTISIRYVSSTQTIIRDFSLSGTFVQLTIPVLPTTETSADVTIQAGATATDDYTVLHIDDATLYAGGTPLYWAPVGFNKIVLYPIPVGGIIALEGLIDPPYAPFWPFDMGDDKLNVLMSYAHHVLAFKEAGVEFQATQPAMLKLVREAGTRNAELRAASFYREYMGEVRDDRERPRKTGQPSAGARG